MRIEIQVQAELAWRVEAGSRAQSVIAFCDPLGISAEADTMEELQSIIPEAINLLMVDLLEDKELDKFLKDRGWHANPGNAADSNSDSNPEFHIPWHLVTEGANGSERRPN